MATQPTQLPVASESPRDLKFNAGKIDEFVTSLALKYQDRFGTEHYTIEGLRQLAQEAIAQFGWITVDSFQDGATLTLPNQVLRDESTGEYYRWDGALPKVVPANSTPQSTGGVGKGGWISVGDASLRTNLMSPNEGMGDALVRVRQPFEGAATRTQHDKNADVLDAADWDITPDSPADQTLKFGKMQSEAAGRKVRLGKGTYIANLSITNTLELLGDSMGSTIVKRPSNSIASKFLSISGPVNVTIENITFDGNKSNNTVGASNISVTSDCASLHLTKVRSTNALSLHGIEIGNDNAIKTDSGIRVIKDSQIDNNGCYGVRVTRVNGVTIENCLTYANGDCGIIVDYIVFPPVAGTQRSIIVKNNRCYENISAGIYVSGFTEGGAPSATLYGPSTNANFNIIVSGNHIRGNKRYGLAVQANGFICSDNICVENGDYTSAVGSAYAGILINGSNGTISNNLCRNNSGYGMDLGGTQYFTCNNNTVMENATQPGGGFVGINLGACQYGTIANNTVGLNGPSGYGTQILVPGYDGGNTSFQTLTTALNITGNTCILGFGSSRIGIRLYGRALECSVTNNKTSGASKFTSIAIETNDPVFVTNNSHSDSNTGVAIPAVNNAAALVIPDFADEVRVTGSNTQITNILTYSHSIYLNKVSEAVVTAQGSGYNPLALPSVTISGGGGSGATAVAAVDGAGRVISINITNAGSGYTTQPTITISAPPSGGTQASATARVGVANFEGRKIRLYFDSATTLSSGNNIVLPGSTTSISIPANGVVDLMGNVSAKLVLAGKSF